VCVRACVRAKHTVATNAQDASTRFMYGNKLSTAAEKKKNGFA